MAHPYPDPDMHVEADSDQLLVIVAGCEHDLRTRRSETIDTADLITFAAHRHHLRIAPRDDY
jgi:hypothetical protein